MLVLSRRLHERIIVGDGPDAIVITVVRIGKGTVKLGIDAPLNTVIRREELPLLAPTERAQEGAIDVCKSKVKKDHPQDSTVTQGKQHSISNRERCSAATGAEQVPLP